MFYIFDYIRRQKLFLHAREEIKSVTKELDLRRQCLRRLLFSTGDFCLSSYCEQANISFSVETALSI